MMDYIKVIAPGEEWRGLRRSYIQWRAQGTHTYATHVITAEQTHDPNNLKKTLL